jgi:hypothetical protein
MSVAGIRRSYVGGHEQQEIAHAPLAGAGRMSGSMWGSSRFAAATVCSVGFVLLLGVPPNARAGFAPIAEQLSEPVAEISHTAEAVDSAGNTTAVWEQNTGHSPTTEQVDGRLVEADGSLGPLLSLSTPAEESYQPAVGVGSGGVAFAAWRVGYPSSVAGRWINLDGSLGPVLTILAGSASEDAVAVHVVVDATGVATVAWYNGATGESDRIELRRISPDGTESAQVNTTLSASEGGGSLSAAVLPGGATFLVSASLTDVVAADGTAAATQNASTSGEVSTLGSGVAFDAQGEGLLAWRRGNGPPDSVIARRVDSAGAPIGKEIVVQPETSDFIGAEQDAAVDSSGHFVVGWSLQDVGNEGHAYARAVNADGSLPDVAHAVSAVARPVPQPLLALDDRGVGIATFDFFAEDAASEVLLGQMLGSGAEPVGEPAQISGGNPTGEASLANEPAAGVASIVWSGLSGAKEVAMDSRYLEPPTCSDSEATVVLGAPVNAPLSCTGIGINNVSVVTPPVHGTLGAFDLGGSSILYTPTPGYQGTDSFVYQMENDGGASAEATVRITVNPAPLTPLALATPIVSNVAQSNRTWRIGSALASFARKHKLPPIGTTFSFTLNEPATVSFAFTQQVGGRKVNHKCVAPTRKNRRDRTCKRTVTRGTLTFTGHGGTNKVSFQGRISHSKKLLPGSYTLLITAANIAAQHSVPRRLSFTILK